MQRFLSAQSTVQAQSNCFPFSKKHNSQKFQNSSETNKCTVCSTNKFLKMVGVEKIYTGKKLNIFSYVILMRLKSHKVLLKIVLEPKF